MITTKFEWHDASAELPAKSGEYLVKTRNTDYLLAFSKRHGLFNVRDEYDEKKIKITAFPKEWVKYWAEVPAIPETESEGA